MLSNLAFGNAGAFFALFAVPLLVLAYLKRDRLVRKEVSSLLLLRQLKTRPARRRRFKPPPRFFFELLALIALTFAATLPSRTIRTPRFGILIDNSMSMSAREKADSAEHTRLVDARGEAAKWISDKPADAVFTLFVTSPRLTVVSSPQLTISEAETALSSISAYPGPDLLESAVSQAVTSADLDELFVVTDRTRYTPGGDIARASGSGGTTRVEYDTVGRPVTNAYFGSVGIDKDPLAGDFTLRVQLRLSGQAPMVARLVVQKLVDGNAAKDALYAETVNLDPQEPTSVTITLPASAAEPLGRTALRLQLFPKPATADAIESDNTAYLGLAGLSAVQTLVVTDAGGDSASLGLNDLPGFIFRTVTAKEFDALTPNELAPYSLLVFHRTAPTAAIERSTLLVVPPAANPYFPVAGQTDTARITSWANDHTITSYLKVPLLSPGTSELFGLPGWARPILTSEQGPVLVAAESRGFRLAAVGFELLPFEGLKTPTASILTLNLISWLARTSDANGSLTTGAVFSLPGQEEWIVRTPSGNESTRKETVPLTEPGVYTMRSKGPTGAMTTAVANVLLPEESATNVLSTFGATNSYTAGPRTNDRQQPLWPTMLAALIVLLIGDVLLFLVRGRTT